MPVAVHGGGGGGGGGGNSTGIVPVAVHFPPKLHRLQFMQDAYAILLECN